MSAKRPIGDVEEDEVLSLQDIINEDNELETMANAVLSGSNDQACTYNDGYVPRQALYACATCKTNGDAGVCLACSLECHDGHELFELYTKRNFRCDCGNSKFFNFKCSLTESKQLLNENNSYNHNFKGTYCTCKRPYPDPEDDVDDEMIQCVVCEDWFHSRHLLGKPPISGYAEMVCHECMKEKAKFLWYYLWSLEHNDEFVDVCGLQDKVGSIKSSGLNGKIKADNPKVLRKVDGIKKEPCKISEHVSSSRECTSSPQSENSVDGGVAVHRRPEPLSQNTPEDTNSFMQNEKIKAVKQEVLPKEPCLMNGDDSNQESMSSQHTENSVDSGIAVFSRPECLSHLIKKYESRALPDNASFWPERWRELLCHCVECEIKLQSVTFLYSLKDTVAEYEKIGADKYKEPSEVSGMKALSGMNHVQQVEVIHGYNDMKDKLSRFLKTFADEGKVVTAEDIHRFFQTMSEAKRSRLDLTHSCK